MAAVAKKSEVNPNNPRGIPSADFIVRRRCPRRRVFAALCVSLSLSRRRRR
jgi:hypothetical protein